MKEAFFLLNAAFAMAALDLIHVYILTAQNNTIVNYRCTRVIQKISSVCEYCRCSAAVTMVRMHAQFVDSVTSHGHNLQRFRTVFTHRAVCL